MKLIAYIDGSCLGNPGEAGFGVVIQDESGQVLETYGRYIGQSTNNVAEYQGLLGCLERIEKYDVSSLTVYSDSQLMVNQINGTFKIKKPHLQVLYNQIHRHLNKLDVDFELEHVPREKNNVADGLARQAVKAKGEVGI